MGEGDLESIVALSLRAWAPVFDSIHETVGSPIFGYFYGEDWRTHQADDVRRACSAYEVLVADDDGRVTGFTAIDLPADGVEGEIYMLAVDPEAQGSGVGTQLTTAAIDHIRQAGRLAAVVETGGDRGHAPARRTYRKAGFTSFPSERFYLLLDHPAAADG
jgi:ribosomal protein S18 acetylase RimI-like enzyme